MTTPPINVALPELPRDEYDALQGWNASLLKVAIAKTPGHAYRQYLAPDRQRSDSPALRLGTYTHEAILEPEALARYVVTDKGSTTKAYANELAAAEAEGRPLAQAKEIATATLMAGSVITHPTLRELLPGESDPFNELTLSWTAPGGHLCKCRLDALRLGFNDSGYVLWIGDVKTASSADPEEFGRSAINYHYLLQAAFYHDAVDACRSSLEVLLNRPEGSFAEAQIVFEFVVIEKEPPYPVARYTVSSEQLLMGRLMYQRALALVETARSIDYWVDYPVNARPLELPPWADRVLSRLAGVDP